MHCKCCSAFCQCTTFINISGKRIKPNTFPRNKYLLRNYLVCSTSLSFKRECHHSIHYLPLGSDSFLLRRSSQRPAVIFVRAQGALEWLYPAVHLHWPQPAQQTKAQTWINHTIALVPSEPAHSASPPLNSAVLKRPSAGLCLSKSISIECKAELCSLPHRLSLT